MVRVRRMAIKKSAVIPYRFKDERLEIMLITRSSGDGWGIPKGKIEEPLEPHISATKEAFEEAGVLGCPHSISIGAYLDNSKSGPIPTFLLEVEIELAKKVWPERKKRARLWVAADECEKYVTDKKLLAVIEKAALCLRSDAEYFKHIIKSFCEARRWNLIAVSGDDAELEIETVGAGRSRINVTRDGSMVKLSAPGSVSFKSEKELSNAFSTELLQRNARNKFGCCAVEQVKDKFVYSYMRSVRLRLLDEDYFAEIAAGLAEESNRLESLVKKVKRGQAW